jgi:hypothetical protein
MRLRGPLIVVAATAFAIVPTAVPAAADELIGTVGPDFTISLTRSGGGDVLQLDPGAFTITVNDRSPDHNFHLSGPGVNQSTDVADTGTVTWNVNFVEGRYTIVCDPHSIEMRRTFVVGNPPASPPPATTPPPASVPKLLATVGPRNTITLRSGSGAVLKSLKPGTYAITVRDRSTRHNFHLVGKGVNRKSTLAGTGTLTWRLKLSAGPLRFYSDRSPTTVKGSLTVR